MEQVNKMAIKRIAVLMTLLAGSATAQGITVSFTDGAPKDRFELTNLSCDLENVALSIDLTATPAGLIFDVTGSGAGVEVYQPVEVVAGPIAVAPITDGAQILAMSIPSFPRGASYTLTADLDDTVSNRQITVVGSEMLGAMANFTIDEVAVAAPFDDRGKALINFEEAGIICPTS